MKCSSLRPRNRWRVSLLSAVVYGLLFNSIGVADEREAVQQAANGTTVLMVRIDSGKVELPPQITGAAEVGSMDAILGTLEEKLNSLRDSLRNGTGYFAVDLPYATRVHARFVTAQTIDQRQFSTFAQSVWPGVVGELEQDAAWRRLPLGSDAESVTTKPPAAKLFKTQVDDWLTALAATEGFPVQCVVVTPEYLRDTFDEIQPELPPALGGGPSQVLVAGVSWLSLGFEPSKLTARLVVQSDSPEAAQALKNHIPKLFRGLLQEAKLDQGASTVMLALLGLLQPKVEGDQVILSFENAEQSQAVIELVKAATLPISRSVASTQTSNNLKQMMLAIHNFESANQTLPTYVELKKKQQASGLSWRVHILPYVEQLELYNKFKLDEPWDSPHNIQLLDQRPELYKPVLGVGDTDAVPATHTTYLAPVGDKTIFGRDKPIGFSNITDGTSNTIAIVEVKPEHAIPWTSPEEYRYDPQNPTGKLRVINGRVPAAMLDGSSHALSIDMPWKDMFTIDGGEVVNW